MKCYLLGHHFPAYYFGDLVAGKILFWRQENPRRFAETEATRGYFGGHDANRPTDPDGNAGLSEFRPGAMVDYYFRQTLELIEAHGIPVYFVSMPISGLSFAAMKPEVKAGYEAYIEKSCSAHANFKELGDPLTTMPIAYYHDDIHLTTAGAILWSRRTRDLLVGAGVDPGPIRPQWQPPGE